MVVSKRSIKIFSIQIIITCEPKYIRESPDVKITLKAVQLKRLFSQRKDDAQLLRNE